MLVCVTFNVGMRDDCACWENSAVKENSEEEDNYSLTPSSACVPIVCVMKLTCAIVSSSSRVGMLREAAFVQKLLTSA
jgi:hypothetical protein